MMPNPSSAPSSRPDSREHADTVRRYLGKQYPETRPAVAALDALLAEVEQANLARIAAEASLTETLLAHKTEVERLEDENERLRRDPKTHPFTTGMDAIARAEAAEALAERVAEAAQESIADMLDVASGWCAPMLPEQALTRIIEIGKAAHTSLADGGQENPA